MPYRRTSTRRAPTTRRYARAPARKYPARATSTRASKPVMKPNVSCSDKVNQGFVNSFVPALKSARFFGKLRYAVTQLNFVSTSANVGTYVFSANGAYDPNITGGSLIPAGFNNLMLIYEHYTVYQSKIVVTFTNNNANVNMVGIHLEPDTTASTDASNMLELPYSQVVQLEPAGVYGSSKTLSMTCNLSKYFGENVLKTTSMYRGDVLSNPTEQAYYHLKCFGLKGTAADVYITVKIEYSAMFTEPREFSPSLSTNIHQQIVANVKEKQEAKAQQVLEHKEVEQVTAGVGLMSIFR